MNYTVRRMENWIETSIDSRAPCWNSLLSNFTSFKHVYYVPQLQGQLIPPVELLGIERALLETLHAHVPRSAGHLWRAHDAAQALCPVAFSTR